MVLVAARAGVTGACAWTRLPTTAYSIPVEPTDCHHGVRKRWPTSSSPGVLLRQVLSLERGLSTPEGLVRRHRRAGHFGRPRPAAPRRARRARKPFLPRCRSLNAGDFVVHVDCTGSAAYRGLEDRGIHGRAADCLLLRVRLGRQAASFRSRTIRCRNVVLRVGRGAVEARPPRRRDLGETKKRGCKRRGPASSPGELLQLSARACRCAMGHALFHRSRTLYDEFCAGFPYEEHRRSARRPSMRLLPTSPAAARWTG